MLVVIIQSLIPVQLFVIPWAAAHQASLSFTISLSVFKLMSIELMMPSNHLIICHTHLLLPSTFSSIRAFSNESALCIRWPKYWSFSISPPVNIQGWFPLGLPGLISLQSKELLGVFSPPTPQFKSIKFSVLSLLCGPALNIRTWLMITLTRWTFISKVMSLLF